MTTEFRVDQIDHVELQVPDLDAAVEWYDDILGLSVLEEYSMETSTGGPVMISSDSGATKVALFEGEPHSQSAPYGLRRLAFRTDHESFASFVDRVGSDSMVYDSDGIALSGVDPVDHEYSFSIYFHDPYGNPLELTTYDHEHVRASIE